MISKHVLFALPAAVLLCACASTPVVKPNSEPLAESPSKVETPLNEQQSNSIVFNRLLTLNDLSYRVTTTGKGSISQLMVETIGLQLSDSATKQEIDGQVVNAEIADMNQDGYPELMIYTQSAGSGSYGDVISYSPVNAKTLSYIAFPNIMDNPKAKQGYMGHDEFAVVENTLVRRFPIYKTGDTNAHPTGMMRQIQYKLKGNGMSPKWVVDKVIEFPR